MWLVLKDTYFSIHHSKFWIIIYNIRWHWECMRICCNAAKTMNYIPRARMASRISFMAIATYSHTTQNKVIHYYYDDDDDYYYHYLYCYYYYYYIIWSCQLQLANYDICQTCVGLVLPRPGLFPHNTVNHTQLKA